MRSHLQSRGAAAFVCAAAFSFVLAACSGGGGSGSGSPVPPAAPITPSSAKSISFASAGTTQVLPQVGGISSSIVLPQNNAPSGAQLDVAVSTSPTQATPQIPAGQPQAFVYFAMTPSADVTLNGSPKVSVTLPSAPSTQGQFYAWLYDTTNKSWLDLAPVTVQGAQITFGGTSKTLTLTRGVQYLAIPFTAAANVSCPTPLPSPTPTPTPPPISGNFYVAAASAYSTTGPYGPNWANQTLFTYDEATGSEQHSLSLNYPTYAYAQTLSLSRDAHTLYVGAYGSLVFGQESTLPLPGLTIVDTASNTIVTQTTIPGGIFAGTLSPDGSRYYGAGEALGQNALFVFDAANGALLNTIPLPSGELPFEIAASTSTVYVGGYGAIYAVNPSNGTVHTFYTSSCNCDMSVGIDPTASKIFTDEMANLRVLSAADGSTLAVLNPPGIKYFLVGNAESADASTLVYQDTYTQLSPTGSDQYGVTVLSSSNNAVLGMFKLPMPGSVSVNANGRFALISQNGNSGFQNVDARALPLGQLYYSITPPNGLMPTAETAQ